MNAAAGYTIAEYLQRWGEVEAASAELEGLSLLDRLALREGDDRGFTKRLLDELDELWPEGSLELAFDRDAWLRPKQLAFVRRTDVRMKLFIAGRRSGKTQACADWCVERLELGARELVLVAPTYDEAAQYMLGGYKKRIDAANGSGLLDLLPPWIEYTYSEDKKLVQFDGAVLRLYSGELPEYRGPGPDSVWGDEIIKWRHAEKLLSNLRIACSSPGKVKPQIVLSTSPKRLKILRDLVMEPDVLTYTGSSAENRGNVDESWFQSETRRLSGTRQGEEELGGKLGVDQEGELFPLGAIDAARVEAAPALDRIVIAIDPGGSQHERADETGLVAAGRAGDIHTGEGYVLEDDTQRHQWAKWGERAYELAEKWGASAFVIERDRYADAAAQNLRVAGSARGYEAQVRPGAKALTDMVHRVTGRRIQIVEVLCRARGDKRQRAEPVSTMYQRRRVHHVGHLTRLETEMSEWDPDTSNSPNGMDAVVHGLTELFQLDRPPEFDGGRAMQGLKEANERLAESDPRRGPERVQVGHDVRQRSRAVIGRMGGRGFVR